MRYLLLLFFCFVSLTGVSSEPPSLSVPTGNSDRMPAQQAQNENTDQPVNIEQLYTDMRINASTQQMDLEVINNYAQRMARRCENAAAIGDGRCQDVLNYLNSPDSLSPTGEVPSQSYPHLSDWIMNRVSQRCASSGGTNSGEATISCSESEVYQDDRLHRAHGASQPILGDKILDSITDFFKTKASGWGDTMQSFAKTLFFILATISLTWTMGFLVLKQADISEFFSELVKFVFTTGLFYWLLLLSTGDLPGAFLSSAEQLATESVEANGESFNSRTTPSSFVGYGLGLFDRIQDVPVSAKGWLTGETQFMFVNAILQHLLVLAILVILSIIAFNWMMCIVTFWVQTYGAIIFLGFGGARWTSDMAINYYKNMLMVVIKLFVIILLANMGAKGINDYIAEQGHDVGILGFASILIIAIAILKLATTIPDLVVAILSSRGTSGAQGVGIGTSQLAGMAMGAVATAGGAAGKGLSMLKDAVSKDKDGDK